MLGPKEKRFFILPEYIFSSSRYLGSTLFCVNENISLTIF